VEEDEFEGQPSAAEDTNSVELGQWPWRAGLALAALVVVSVSTLFMTYPAGLSNVGELLSSGFRGLAIARPFTPPLFPVLITLFYEPFMVLLGVGALIWLWSDDSLSGVERFFTGWLIVGTIASVIYAGSGPEHALWIILPLYGLVSSLVVRLLEPALSVLWWNVPWWAKWLVALAMIALLAMLAVHSQSLARSMLGNATAVIQIVNVSAYNVIWIVIIILFMLIGYFLASSLWGTGTTIRGALLGVLAFGMVTSLGSGWYIAVANASNPIEFWNRNATDSDTFLLRRSLLELADRQAEGIPAEMRVVALAPDDGVIAWLLRDFPLTQFIPDAGAAKTEPIVLLPTSAEEPDLGGSYVGQRFIINSTWDFASMTIWNFPAWWLQRRTLTGPTPTDAVVLWLRQDIYNGVPFTLSQ
jgi:hypothetical protein